MDDQVFDRFVELLAAQTQKIKQANGAYYDWKGMAEALSVLFERRQQKPLQQTGGGRLIVLDKETLRNMYNATLKWLRTARLLLFFFK
jgi:hypothetical protein